MNCRYISQNNITVSITYSSTIGSILTVVIDLKALAPILNDSLLTPCHQETVVFTIVLFCEMCLQTDGSSSDYPPEHQLDFVNSPKAFLIKYWMLKTLDFS